jgi:two-component system, NarL family, sensor kinase
MKQSLFVIVIFFAVDALFGQTPWTKKRDSLLLELSRAKEDTNKVWTMVRLGNLYLNNQKDSAEFYAKTFGELSKKLNYATGKGYSLSMQAFILSDQSKFDEAIALDLQAIEILKTTPRIKSLASVYNNTAMIYGAKNDESSSVEYYLKSEALYEQLKDSADMALIYGNLGSAYISLREFDNAYTSSLKGILLCRSLHTDYSLGATMINLGSALVNLQRFDTTIVVLDQAEEVLRIANGSGPNPMVLKLLELTYLGLGKFDLVKSISEKLLAIGRSTGDEWAIGAAFSGLGDYYSHEKKFSTARSYVQKFLEIAEKRLAPMDLRAAYNQALAVEVSLGNLARYDYYSGLRDSIDDKVRSDRILKNTQEMEAKYSLNRKQAEIDDLNKQQKIQQLILRQRNTMNWVLASVVLVAGLVGFLYNRNYRQRKKLLMANTLIQQQRITELEKEKQLLAAQAVLQGQVEERTRLAKDLHDGLGSILSSAKYSFNHMKENLIITPENAAAFEKSMGMLDKSISELRRVAHNMMPEALMKFGLDTALKDFCNSVEQSGALQLTYQSFGLEESSIPEVASAAVYRIVQELVNNILKHSNATTALVQLIRKDAALSITVEDNGKGFDASILQHSDGMGYLNLKNRMAYMNGSIDIQTGPGKGTSVNIEISNITA